MLTNKLEKTVELPHEPGQWVKVRMPSGFMKLRSADMSNIDGGLYLFESCILGWSYDEPVTREAIWELDDHTIQLILTALLIPEPETDRKNVSTRSTKR